LSLTQKLGKRGRFAKVSISQSKIICPGRISKDEARFKQDNKSILMDQLTIKLYAL
jgi:hypothetical protein